MSAELLKRAAAKLREHAFPASSGPWELSWSIQDLYLSSAGSGTVVAEWTYGVAPHRPESYDEADTIDPQYIALMHPPVALALAEMLDDAAGVVESAGPLAEQLDVDPHELLTVTSHAVAVARAVLREPS